MENLQQQLGSSECNEIFWNPIQGQARVSPPLQALLYAPPERFREPLL